MAKRQQEAERLVAKQAAAHPLVITTSSEKGLGIPELRAELASMALAP